MGTWFEFHEILTQDNLQEKYPISLFYCDGVIYYEGIKFCT